MIKNSIIALLLIHILNMYEGWAVAGTERLLVSIVLVVLLSIIFSYIEEYGKKVLHLRYTRSIMNKKGVDKSEY